MKRSKIAILVSGEGTTAESVIRASANRLIETQVSLIICNKPSAGIFARTQKLNKELGLNISCVHIGRDNYPPQLGEKLALGDQTEAEEIAILEILKKGDFDAICLMGYAKRIGQRLIHEFGWRPEYSSPFKSCMVNTHPGLLPDTKGLYGIHVQEYVLQQGHEFGGQTLHIVAVNYDEGPTVTTHQVKVIAGDTPDSLFARVQMAEKKYLPKDIDEFIKNRHNYIMKVSNES